MNSRMRWILFLLLLALSAEAQQRRVVTLGADTAQFFLDAYYRGQRDSLRVKNLSAEMQKMDTALSIRSKQISSYKNDSARNVRMFANLAEQKKVSVDSTAIVTKQQVKRKSAWKDWALIGLLAYALAKTF